MIHGKCCLGFVLMVVQKLTEVLSILFFNSLFRYTVDVPTDSFHVLYFFSTNINWKDITESPSTCAENYAKADVLLI